MMDIIEITAEQYKRVISHCIIPYNSAAFNLLNRQKIKSLKFLLFKTKKKKFGFACGISSATLKAPFSAPFACFEPLDKNISTENYCEAVSLLEKYAVQEGCESIQIGIPPVFYANDHLNKMTFALAAEGFKVQKTDIGFVMNLKENFGENYLACRPSNTRRNLKIATVSDLQFTCCEKETDISKAYDIIRINRRQKHYPLHMKLKELTETMKLIPGHVFLISFQGEAIASAFVYHLSDTVAQLIYWGNISGYEHVKPMNYLAYNLFRFYKNIGIEWLDIGPSSSDGVPNYGLCDFKQSLGCNAYTKSYYSKKTSGG